MRKLDLLPTWDCEAGYGPGKMANVMFEVLDGFYSL